jgi:hypothetical protein
MTGSRHSKKETCKAKKLKKRKNQCKKPKKERARDPYCKEGKKRIRTKTKEMNVWKESRTKNS